jgi:fibro-slime domain-containing protein
MRAIARISFLSLAFATAVFGSQISACSLGSNGTVGSPGGSNASRGGTAGSPFTLTSVSLGGAVSSNAGAGGSTAAAAVWPPPGYTNVTDVSYGAYGLGPLLSSLGGAAGGSGGTGGSSGGSPDRCGGLYGLVRDFKMSTTPGGHPDFQHDPTGDDKGIVETTLGSDGKPVYAHPGGTTLTTTGQANFDQWYRDVQDVNMTYLVGLHFVQNGSVITFAASLKNTGVANPNTSYFPLDNEGFGNQGQPHNFSFTTEIHTAFTYNGGETFTFQGDDDVWVFINDHLAIDLGGIHNQETQSVNLDQQAATLGITTGNVYPLAVFNAERHTVQSNFRVDTTLAFTDCGQVNGQIIIY